MSPIVSVNFQEPRLNRAPLFPGTSGRLRAVRIGLDCVILTPMKKITAVLLCVLVASLFVSCGTSVDDEIPIELVFSETTDLYQIFYPMDWSATVGSFGGTNITNKDGSITIPILIVPDDNVKDNDLDTIADLIEILKTTNSSGKAMEKRISGKTAYWWYFDVQGVELTSFMLPLDGVIVSCMVYAKNLPPERIHELDLARKIVESFRLR